MLNTISVILWPSALFVEEKLLPGMSQAQDIDKLLSHKVVSNYPHLIGKKTNRPFKISDDAIG